MKGTIRPKQAAQKIQAIVDEAREQYLALKLERTKENLRLQHLLARPTPDPEAIGEARGRVTELQLRMLKCVIASYLKQEESRGTTTGADPDADKGASPKVLKKMDPPPTKVIVGGIFGAGSGGDGGGGGGGVVCEYVGDESGTMQYVCTSVTDPSIWSITWKGGGFSRFSGDPDLEPIPAS